MRARLVYKARSWVIDTDRRHLRVDGALVPIGSRAFEIMEALVASAGRFVTKDELIAHVWPHTLVEEQTLRVHISAIRKALGPDRTILKTAPGRGYLLIAGWTVEQGNTQLNRNDLTRDAAPFQPSRGNLPAASADLIGRQVALQQLSAFVSAYRIVTLTGPAGIGKTTLALEVARNCLDEFDDGGWLVELASLTDPQLVSSTVAKVLRLELGGVETSPNAIARAIGSKKLLILLDNCEHVVEAAADLAETIGRQCSHTTILATSREVLRVDGERTYRLPPLEIPASDHEPPGQLLHRTAVKLFVARTQALSDDFSPGADNYPAVAAICRLLDGIPLAIEFAAARTATLGVWQVAAALADRFELLRNRHRTALPRHQTLRAALDWSYKLLPDAEKLLLRYLSIFAGGFTLEAAAAVINKSDLSGVIGGISNLVSKSLIMPHDARGNGRFRMLETVRAYAFEKLEDGEATEIAERHAQYFRDLFTLGGDSSLARAVRVDTAQGIDEIDNVRAALDWSFSSRGSATVGVDLTAAYTPVWFHFALLIECRQRCEQALSLMEQDANTHSHMRLQGALGNALIATWGPTKQGMSATLRALEIATIRDDPEAQAQALGALIPAFLYLFRNSEALIAVERLRQVGHRLRERSIIVRADRLLGNTLTNMGKPGGAQQCFERVLRTVASGTEERTIWNHSNEGPMSRAVLSLALLLQGFAEKAYDEARKGAEELRGTQHRTSLLFCLSSGLCRIALMTGDLNMADEAIAEVIALAKVSNLTLWSSMGRCLAGKLMIERLAFAEGIETLHEAVKMSDRAGWDLLYPEFKGALAIGLARVGRIREARDVIDEAIGASDDHGNGQVWFVPELLRIKGELLRQQTPDPLASEAEEWFGRAGTLARQQGAVFWELRTALSVARLRVAQHRPSEARELLAAMQGRFTEGFATADLRAARVMLNSLLSRSDVE